MHLKLSNDIKAEAARLGFFACGMAEAKPVNEVTATAYRTWLARNHHGTMDYLANYVDKKLNPQLLVPGVKSMVCVALNYTPAQRLPLHSYQLAGYAYGKDYHDVMKTKLRQLAQAAINLFVHGYDTPGRATREQLIAQNEVRVFCDTAPVLERYWAVQAGLGWIGRHHQLIIPKAGSHFFLGEVFLPFELTYDQPQPNRCGNCHRCVDACPTKVLVNLPHNDTSNGYTFDARKCISYQTIENRGEISREIAPKLNRNIYGCDICLQACPWNKRAPVHTEPDFMPSPQLLNMTSQQWQQLTEEQYRQLFKGSAVKRAKYSGLMRNIRAVAVHDDTSTPTQPL